VIFLEKMGEGGKRKFLSWKWKKSETTGEIGV
jgi:hypothetical protein